jgi:hypothetical protein
MNSPRQFVRLFQPRFAHQVETRVKRQTIRPIPARIPLPGDLISCRAWTGKPYRSPQRILLVSPIQYVVGVKIGVEGVWCADIRVENLDAFAKADGFEGWVDMRSWFIQNHDLVGSYFRGILIRW